MDSINGVRDALLNAVLDSGNKVTALTGRWGTGKTHLWDSLRVEKTLKVSAFGAKSIEDIKRKLLQECLVSGGSSRWFFGEGVGSILNGVSKKLFGLNVNDAALVVLPGMVKGKIIVIDDIERKSDSLKIDSMLGFINEYAERHGARFLLILNTDSMGDKALWQSFHEKVIDKEVVLSPGAEVSFSIACSDFDLPFNNVARDFFVRHKIQNIRVIRKTLNALREVFSRQEQLPERIYEKYIPIIAFLGVCHFHGFGNVLTIDYVANHIFGRGKVEGAATRDKELGAIIDKDITRADKLCEIVVDYFKFGFLAHEDVSSFFRPLIENVGRIEFRQSIDNFIFDVNWDAKLTRVDVLKFIEGLAVRVYELEDSQLINIYNALCQHEFVAEAEGVVRSWLKCAEADPKVYKRLEYLNLQRAPKMLREFRESLTLPEEEVLTFKGVLLNAMARGDIKGREVNVLLRVTRKDYAELLRCLSKEDLKDVVEFNFRMGQKGLEEHWQYSRDMFIAACRHISNDASETRLGKILRRELDERGILGDQTNSGE